MNLIPQIAEKTTSAFIRLLRQLEPLYRDKFDQSLRQPIEDFTQTLIRRRLSNEGLSIAQEKILPFESEIIHNIKTTMMHFLEKEYRETGKVAERAGNTKTYGLVKANFKVNPDLPKDLNIGIFQANKSYPAYIRFGGPGPRVVPDTQDNGILSFGMKLMGVPGKKLLKDEKHTVDFSGISAPSFTTPNILENIKLQQQIGRGTPAWYFLNPFDSHYLDMVMQGLYAKLHSNPLSLAYYSCVPYLFGHKDGHFRAIKFAIFPRLKNDSQIGALTDNYLRAAMIKTLQHQAVQFDFAIQFQTDPINMPIEDASVIWSEKHSPFIKVATIDIPKQTFTHPKQDAFARKITVNPWHTLAIHRPLGNQNRARKTVYQACSRMRQDINSEAHIEPTGKEVFNSNRIKKDIPETQANPTSQAIAKREAKIKIAEPVD